MDATAPDGALERETVITTSDGDHLVTIERNRWAPNTGAKRNVQLSEARKAELSARLHAHRTATIAKENAV